MLLLNGVYCILINYIKGHFWGGILPGPHEIAKNSRLGRQSAAGFRSGMAIFI
jgi:hypothetical protein